MAAKNLGSFSGDVQRRTALGLLTGAGATVALAACATEGSPPIQTTPPSGTVDESPSAVGGRRLLGDISDVPVGTGARFKVDDLEILVTHPVAGEFYGFDATCTHAGCIVTGVIESEIACACHGARFDMTTGAVLAGPARSALGKIAVVAQGEKLFADL